MNDDALWFKDAIIYQLRLPSYCDSDGDGIGDLRGLIGKLDYLQDLGVSALWLLPFYPSPLRDDGYDIADYTSINPDYGTLREFRTLLREAHRRDLRVICELVLNHTSDQHAWFQRARRAPPGSPERDFYVWSDTPERYTDARIIFKDFEPSNWSWDPVAKAYYWHRFFSHQPDLNFDNPAVHKALFAVLDHWLEMGVDGLRLDAVPYLYEREGTSCENLPETHAFLRKLREHVDHKFGNRMLLAEANQWPEDAVPYFGKGDECHMAFHFPIMPRLFMAIHMEDRYPILDILSQTPEIPESCQWAMFLRNHDELTLEMVTDEERDYMWRVYARDPRARINLGIRRRLAPLLGNNRRRIELMNALLLALPGTPVIYYGDEIGMGDNVYLGDRNGVRTPMQWSPDRNAGFSSANPQRLFLPLVSDPEYHYEAVNVEIQQGNAGSLLWWTKRILALRKQFQAFGRGTLEPLTPSNRRMLAFVRRFGEERLLVVANLSRFAQYAELDLSEFKGCVPLELFGHVEFPPVGEAPYFLSLGPHGFFWFSLEAPRAVGVAAARPDEAEPPLLEVEGGWERALTARGAKPLERYLPDWLRGKRWFRGKARRLRRVAVVDSIPVEAPEREYRLVLVEASYDEGESETYALALAFDPAPPAPGTPPGDVLARLRVRNARGALEGVLREASTDPALAGGLLDALARRRRLRGESVELHGVPARDFRRLRGKAEAPAPARALGVEQSNTSWVFGEQLVGKLLRRVEQGPSPDLEIVRHLTERAGFEHVPPLAGHLELRRGRETGATLAVFQVWVANEGDAWAFTLDEIDRYFEQVLARSPDAAGPPPAPARLMDRVAGEPPAEALEYFGAYLESARLLGQRTGELHVALASAPEDPAFAPEPITPFSRRSLYQSLRNQAVRTFEALRAHRAGLPEPQRPGAEAILAREDEILERFRSMLERDFEAARIRCHGDYHLGQVLYTGRDFVIIDFEGEPARPLDERRRKRCPLADVAGMLRSFHYAVASVLSGGTPGQALRPEDLPVLEPWGRLWYAWVSSAFLRAYREAVAPARIVPEDPAEFGWLLDHFLLEKNLYEVAYELGNRPDWIGIPLRGMLDVLAPTGAG